MTIQEIRQTVTRTDLNTRSVYITTTIYPNPLRVKGIGRMYVTVMLQDGSFVRVEPANVTGVQVPWPNTNTRPAHYKCIP